MNPQGRKKHTPGLGVVQQSGTVKCPRCGGSGKVAPEGISIGDRFREARLRLKKTQAEIAPDLGISRAQLANLEGDRSRPGLEMLMKAADVFGCTIDYLLRGSDR